MKISGCLGFLCSCAFLTGCVSAEHAGARPPAENRVTVELFDGSRIVGRLVSERLQFDSASLGKLDLPVRQIRSLDWKAKGAEGTLRTAKGDQFQARLTTPALRVRTDFGEFRLASGLLRHVQISVFGGQADLRRGLVALWSAEDNARDSVEGHDGSLLHGADYGEGKVGRAFHFAADQARVYIPDAEDFAVNGSFTLAGWVKVAEFPPVGGAGCICARGDERPGWDTWSLSTLPGENVGFGLTSDTGEGFGPKAPAKSGEWFHLACVYDEQAGRALIYVDGRLAQEKEAGKLAWHLEPGLDPSVCFGNVSGKFHRFPFRGWLDEWALYARALSFAEVQALVDLGNAGERILPAKGSN